MTTRRRGAAALAFASCFALGLPGAGAGVAAASAPRAGAAFVEGGFGSSPRQALAHWTAARRRGTAALPLRLLAGRSSGAASSSGAVSRTAAKATAVEGTDTGDSTAFPNRTNGTVYGEFRTSLRREAYRCSGSVVDSESGDVVLTAGHCVIDPETGTVASYVVFVPGYREGAEPFGEWAAEGYATTPEWAETAGGGDPDEAGDVAMLVLEAQEGHSVQSEVGALGIGFGQSRSQTYTQYGYPSEGPYDGEALYSHLAPYLGGDALFSPATMKIASDFTAGASGGPWTVGSDPPVALSVTDYGYEEDPGFLYGPYFGSTVRTSYEAAADGLGETSGGDAPAPASPSGADQAVTTGSKSKSKSKSGVGLRLVGVRRDRRNGSATLIVRVTAPGTVRLSGPDVRASGLVARSPGTLGLPLRARGGAARKLRESGHVAVVVHIVLRVAGHAAVSRARLIRLTMSG